MGCLKNSVSVNTCVEAQGINTLQSSFLCQNSAPAATGLRGLFPCFSQLLTATCIPCHVAPSTFKAAMVHQILPIL